MKIIPVLVLALLPLTASSAQVCSLFPADLNSIDATQQIQRSIDACAQSGGGELKLLAQTYRIGPIQLRSHVHLSLASGTLLLGSEDKNRYARAFIGWPFRAEEALISANQVTDTGITGPGVIDGGGASWWDEAKKQRQDGTMAKMFPSVPDANGMPRPWLLEFSESNDITVDGPTLRNAPMWNLVLRESRDIRIRNLTISNPADSPNTDGIDVISSHQLEISHVKISTGDDNITIKSGLAGFALPRQSSSKILISDAVFGRGHGLSVGSETLNGISDLDIERISFDGTDNGLRIKTGRDRGSVITRIHAREIRMRQVGTALSISAYYPKIPDGADQPQAVTSSTPFISDIRIEDMEVDGAETAGVLIGLPEAPLREIKLAKLRIKAKRGIQVRNASLHLEDVRLDVTQGQPWNLQEGSRIAPQAAGKPGEDAK